jgi:hypothetical protein
MSKDTSDPVGTDLSPRGRLDAVRRKLGLDAEGFKMNDNVRVIEEQAEIPAGALGILTGGVIACECCSQSAVRVATFGKTGDFDEWFVPVEALLRTDENGQVIQ